MARTLITLPASMARGALVEIRTLIAHPMETGYRPGSDGKLLPRDVLKRFTCTFETATQSELVFEADLFPAIAANPYLSFWFKANESGQLRFNWIGDNGFAQTEVRPFSVT